MVDITYDELVRHRGSIHNDGELVSQNLRIFTDSMKITVYYDKFNSNVNIGVLLRIEGFDIDYTSFVTIFIPLLYYADDDDAYKVSMAFPQDGTFTDFIAIKNDTCRVSTHQVDRINDISFSLKKVTFFNKYIFGMYWKDFIEKSFCNYQISIET